MESVSHIEWVGGDQLPESARAALIGPGSVLELTREPVLGSEQTVFAQRPRSLRAALDVFTADLIDEPVLVSPVRQWTYREMKREVDALATLLRERYGISVGDRVAIVAANSAEYALLMWSVVTLGAILTSLNGWWTTPELRYGIALTAPKLIAGDERRLARLPADEVPDGTPVRLIDEILAEADAYRDSPLPAVDIDEDAPAVILFTSGTTGRPKGATLSHRNLINFGMVGMLNGAIRQLAAGTSAPVRSAVILTSPMFHVSGLVGTFISSTFFRTKLIFAPPGKWDPDVYMSLTEAHAVTNWSGVPTNWWRLLRSPNRSSYDLSSVLNISTGGAVLAPELVREIHELFPHASIGNGYGMSETVGLGTLSGGELILAFPDSVGVASPTSAAQIRGDGGEILACDEIGEIYLRSPSVFLGYWGDDAATAAALDPQRWYRTGDFGRISNGMLFLESRRRDLILRGGENIYPIEIENRLIEHPDIDDSAVIGIDDPELGQAVKAFVVPHPGSQLSAEDVRHWCQLALASYKVPTTVEFRDELPYSLMGKLLKQELELQEKANQMADVVGTARSGLVR